MSFTGCVEFGTTCSLCAGPAKESARCGPTICAACIREIMSAEAVPPPDTGWIPTVPQDPDTILEQWPRTK